MTEPYDYIIVGGGAAGCVLANRLSQRPDRRVLLLEAGPEDRHPYIHMPRGIGKILSDPAHVWPFVAHPAPGANGPGAVWVRGKTLGGSSSVNGMMYVRGQPADFADLARVTSEDWSWREIGRAYDEIEGNLGTAGGSGRLRISRPRRHLLMDRVIASGRALGLDAQPDVNTPDDRAKIGYCPATIAGGRRQSAAVAFLKPVRRRPNLTVVTGVSVDRVVFDGLRAIGVAGRVGNEARTYNGRRIVLAAGTFGSPALLQRSGVGPRELLDRLGIPVVADRPEVGENLREHCALAMQWRLRRPISLNPQFSGWRLLLNGLRYYLTRTGPLATAAYDVLALFSSGADGARPDAQLIAAPFTIDKTRKVLAMEREPGMQIAIYPLRPRSRGRVAVASRDPDQLPTITLDFFDEPQDRAVMLGAVRFVRTLVEQSPLADQLVGETRPGPDVASDADILDAYRAMGTTAYHACGTCRMGEDAASVVDPLTRVRGVEALHVVDLSIAPDIPAGNTLAPVVAMAWRGAELIAALDAEAPASVRLAA